MLTGIGMLLPVMMIYNGYQYLVFAARWTTAATAGNSRVPQQRQAGG
jgi:hypothetical protein